MLPLRWIGFATVLLLLGSARLSCAAWQVARSESLSNRNGVAHLRYDLENSGRTAELDVVLFSNRTHTLRVIDDPADRLEMSTALDRAGCLAGVNGGYFHPDRRPLGLLIVAGRKVHPQETAKLLSGVAVVRQGKISLLRTGELKATSGISDAVQAGPFLVDGRRPVIGLNGTKSAARTAIASGQDAKFALVSCSPVTLAEFGEILGARDLLPGLQVIRALNLDGGSSTGIWVRGDGKPFYLAPWKRVRNFVGVIPRKSNVP